MRPLLCAAVVLASGLAVGIFVPSGAASANAPGDGCLVAKSGFGNVSITLTRCLIFGRVQSAESIVTDDTVGADGLPPPRVIGWDSKHVLPDGSVRYTTNASSLGSMRFRSTGAVKIRITQATFLDLSVVGKGVAVLSNGGLNGAINLYSVDAASFCQDTFLPLTLKPIKVSISSPES